MTAADDFRLEDDDDDPPDTPPASEGYVIHWAGVLIQQFGVRATAVAEGLAQKCLAAGDLGQYQNWTRVAAAVRLQ